MKSIKEYPKHKRRKLEYIRTKFAIQRGGKVSSCFKVPNQFPNDGQQTETLIKEHIDSENKALIRRWKVNLIPASIQMGSHEDDFVQDMQTVRVDYAYRP